MIRTTHLLIALCIFSVVASAQDDPLAWFPLQVGSHWVYEYEAKSGDRNRPDVDRWTSEETITGWVTTPEGVVVLREVKNHENSTDQRRTERVIGGDGELRFVQEPSYNRSVLTGRDGAVYLIHGNCIYVISGGWDAQKQELRPDYRRYLSEGSLPPDFCFPLQMGREWGNADRPWRVEPARDNVGSFLPSEYAGAIHIFSDHFGSGGLEDVWFQKGVGVVGVHYIHNGTYDEYTKKLVSR
jgi:hypothetical protein